MKRKLKQWIAVLCLLMLLAASLHLARAESAPAQEECAPYRIVLTAPGGWNRSNSAVVTVSVKDAQNLGWYQMAYRMNDGDWTDCEQLFDKSKAEIAVHENGMFTFRITDPHGHTFEESTRVAVIDRSAPITTAWAAKRSILPVTKLRAMIPRARSTPSLSLISTTSNIS